MRKTQASRAVRSLEIHEINMKRTGKGQLDLTVERTLLTLMTLTGLRSD